MHRKIIAALTLASLAASPVSAQTMLDKLIKRVTRPKSAAAMPGQPSGVVASITPAQTAAIERLLAAPMQDAKIAADRTGAAELIRTLLSTGACAKSSTAWNGVNRYHLTPFTHMEGHGGELVAMANLQYHDRNRCLDVVRLTDWSKPAANALTFRAYYLAEDSGEAKRQKFEIQKASDGQWMIREIGVGLH